MMKKMCLIALCAMCVSTVCAKSVTQGFGFQVGFSEPIYRLNSPTLTDKTELEATPLNGFKLGLLYDATFIKGFGATIGLNYTFAMDQTQWQSQGTFSEYPKTKSRTMYNQLELVVDWQYKFEIAKQTYLILYTGPTIQCGLSMDKTTYLMTQFQQESSSSCSSYDYDDATMRNDYNRLNVTWGVGAGFQYERFFIRGGYDFGMMNPYHYTNFNKITTATYDDRNTRGRLDQWAIKVGMYLF